MGLDSPFGFWCVFTGVQLENRGLGETGSLYGTPYDRLATDTDHSEESKPMARSESDIREASKRRKCEQILSCDLSCKHSNKCFIE